MQDDEFREVAELRLRKFWADAVTKAGGADELAGRLAELGIVGRDGPYHPKSIEAWRGGRRQAAADVVFAIAADLEMSLDFYVHGEAIEQPGAELLRKIEALERTQDWLLAWLMRDPDFAEAIRKRGELRPEEAAG